METTFFFVVRKTKFEAYSLLNRVDQICHHGFSRRQKMMGIYIYIWVYKETDILDGVLLTYAVRRGDENP